MTRRPTSPRSTLLRRCILVALFCAAAPALALPAGGDWIEVEYGDLVDRRVPSHSGETVGELLQRLGGRPVPRAGERPEDRQAHALLEPLVERYAFVLADALDAVHGAPDPPLVEVGWLWQPGSAQPAWAELLRARRYLVESDGAATLRVCVPVAEPFDVPPGAARPPSVEAARDAWTAAWPVLRHVLAAEQRRIAEARGKPAAEVALTLRVHAYRHHPERSSFVLGTAPFEARVSDTRPDGLRPPLDLAAWQAFLERGLRLEGGRLEPDGALRPFGSAVAEAPRLLGRPLRLGDLAVAWRAVAHGGRSEPYMSLDRGYSPQTAIVNYGGRLQDTALGLVSLLCDIRFKTFSLGIDVLDGRDLRTELRRSIPEFRTHVERFAADPASRGVMSQQTRLWFYPDRVDLTLSAQGDVLVLRRVRMSAASERVDGGPGRADPPWTLATVEAIDRDYDRLAPLFPELGDLDEVVRLLALAAWLDQSARGGQPVPELDALLALELEPQPTPRRFPQLLAFNALPAPGATSGALVFDRVPIGAALERLAPADGRPLPARRRAARALAALDASDPQAQALLAEARLEGLDTTALDALAFRAERLRMHQTVLSTLDAAQRGQIVSRQAAGEELRVFSVAIGGLDLGMGQALSRAAGRDSGLGSRAEGAGGAAPPAARPTAPVEAWRSDPDAARRARVPDHGLGARPPSGAARREFGNNRIEVTAGPDRTVWTLLGADSPDVRSRRVGLDPAARPAWIERAEGAYFLRYRFDAGGGALVARALPAGDASAAATSTPAGGPAPPAGLATLRVGSGGASDTESPTVRLRLEAAPGGVRRPLEAEFPRALLQRIVTGRAADPTPDRPLAALGSLPAPLGAVDTVMFLAGERERRAPWQPGEPIAGEEDSTVLARSIREWWSVSGPGGTPLAAVSGTDEERSPQRWAAAPRPGAGAVLLLPDAFPLGASATLEAALRAGWRAGPVVAALDGAPDAELVVLVSAEAPGPFAARLRALARDPRLRGKLLAAWSLAGAVRSDVPGSVLAEGALAGLGVAAFDVAELRDASALLAAFQQALAESAGRARIEALGGPFLWYF